MKKILLLTAIVYTLLVSSTLNAQEDTDSTGLPGDQFSLYGALELFKKSSSPEEFEKLLNTEGSNVNNLDLNNDGQTDYIKIIDKQEENIHILILQVPVTENESQDIATIEIEKTGEGNAVLQIVGDEDIFGEEVIIEPSDEESDLSFFYTSPDADSGPAAVMEDLVESRVIVNVWAWPGVRFIYTPGYRLWVSPWRWHAHPGWWRPWRPHPWHVWHPHRFHYRNRYAVVHTHRVVRARGIYRPMRVTSVSVHRRHQASVKNYRVTRKTTTVRGRHNGRPVKVKRTTTTVRRKRGR